MVSIVRVVGERGKEIGSILWRCVYSFSLTLLCSAGLAFIPQGTEFLRLVSDPGWTFPIFIFSVASWSTAAWYSARLTLGRVFDGTSLLDRTDTPFVNSIRMWLPRFLGIVPASVLSIQFQRLGQPALALACFLTAFAMGVFVLKRRAWFASRFRGFEGQTSAIRFESLQGRTVLTVALAILLTFALLFAVWLRPVEVTRYVTAPALLCFAFASWILFGDLVLTYSFKQARLPSMAALPLLLFIVFSLWNDNHQVRLLPIAADDPAPIRRKIDAHLDDWLQARVASGTLVPGRPFPLFVVAAEGGGIRAAYWTGMVLAKLQDDSGARFGRHLFALSGVSGGSLGSSAFAALLADAGGNDLANAYCARGGRDTPYQECMRKVLQRDFLSPTLGYMLYPDMLQRFLPFAIAAADRARAMEAGWEQGWLSATGNERFARRFDQLWAADGAMNVPSLLLNATLVDGGNRIIASDLIIDGSFPDAYDALDPVLDLHQMSLGTAVHNSARFSYISPAGTVSACRAGKELVACAPGVERAPWGRIIDGGYFENSGVESVRDLLFAMRPTLARWRERGYDIDPAVVVISNSPDALAPREKQDPAGARMDTTFLSELLAPPLGLFNTRTARATFAVTAERRDMAVILPAGPARFLWFGMPSETHTPLGWALAGKSFKGIDALLAPPHDSKQPFEVVLKRLPPP
ncbi:hypothetical protein [Massilia antarctica]|uniref:hypothetical protein n=1 Tax=Massilia antarctica TaxID=2765360 RepID=UPI0006BB8649|nr:hypothetical protein [Massilia sp. H27-R4]MCY0914626.1 hypothetical protein [Massilia sp. H27-R4]CUI08349.1 hypothetical protein BN2497_11475 [Janthinobacterium sp. CG23_2]CUU32135.1 hypothetical protein BN3177_11475 [Janthinobacterium sp. CG23_2]